jgi:hypothetical protein
MKSTVVVIDRIGEPHGWEFSFVDVSYHFERNGMSTGDGGQMERITIDHRLDILRGDDGDKQRLWDYCQVELSKIHDVDGAG